MTLLCSNSPVFILAFADISTQCAKRNETSCPLAGQKDTSANNELAITNALSCPVPLLDLLVSPKH